MDQATGLRQMIKKDFMKARNAKRDNGNGALSMKNGPRVIAVSSGKGGVGKTNIVGNLAVWFQRKGRKVLILDADLGLANIDIIYGLHPLHSIDEVLKGKKDLSQIIIKGPEGVSLIPASSGIQELAHLTDGQKISLLSEFDSLNDRFDILLIDTGAGISSNVIYFNLAADEKIIVVTPEPTSITDAYALMKIMFQQHGTKGFSLLLNMVENEVEAKSVYSNLSRVLGRFMGDISVDYAGYVSKDKLITKAVSCRTPVVCRYPESVASQNFETVASEFLMREEGNHIDGNIKFFWKRLMSGSAE